MSLYQVVTRCQHVAAAQTAAACEAFGVRAVPLAADFADVSSVTAVMEQARVALGEMDILINNAGIFLQGWCQDITLDDWQRT